MADEPLEGAGASPPSFILDLSSSQGGGGVCFLLVYKKKDGALADLALVSGNAVFSTRTDQEGLEGCVYKPQSRKSLKTKDHIAKVGQALEAVAAADAAVDAAAGAVGGSDPPPSATTTTPAMSKKAATLALEIVGTDSAKLIVKEVKSLGAVDLAVVTLPIVNEAGGSLLRGLLLGAVVETHKRTKEAGAMGRDRDKARREQVKVQGLLEGAIRDKRKTVTNILEKAVLVVNAKKDRIKELEEKIEMLEDNDGGSRDGDQESSISGGGGSSEEEKEEDEVHTDDDGRTLPPGTGNKRKGKAAARAEASEPRGAKPTNGGKGNNDGSARSGSTATTASRGEGSRAGGRGSSPPGAKGPGRGRGGGGDVRVKSEPKLGAGGGALATPMGTQELSQDELLELVDGKVKTGDHDDYGNDTSRRRKQRDGGGNGTGLKRPRDSGGPQDKDDDEDEDDGFGTGVGGSEAALYVGDLGGSTDSDDDGNAGPASQRIRRRKKIKKSSTTAAAAQGGSHGGGDGGGGSGGVAAGLSDGGGGTKSEPPASTGTSIWDALTADSDEELAGLK
eukprot:g7379.t1